MQQLAPKSDPTQQLEEENIYNILRELKAQLDEITARLDKLEWQINKQN